jgi:hypothetical protein
MTSSPEATPHTANELTAPLDARRRVSIASDPPTIVDGRRSPYFGGQETRRRLSVASSDHQASDGRRKSILVQHTPDTMSVHSHHSGNAHYVNRAYQQDGESACQIHSVQANSRSAGHEVRLQHNVKGRRMPSSGILRRVALVGTDVSEELSASIIKVTRIGCQLLLTFLVHRFLSP